MKSGEVGRIGVRSGETEKGGTKERVRKRLGVRVELKVDWSVAQVTCDVQQSHVEVTWRERGHTGCHEKVF